MAITALEFMVLCSFREHQILPQRPRVLELGESNWYGDINPAELEQEIHRLNRDPNRRNQCIHRLRNSTQIAGDKQLYELAQVFFHGIVDAAEYVSIDPGTPTSHHQFDLNHPVPLTDQFDLTINIGTAEHIFNVYQFFKTAHDRTKPSGVMMHSSPYDGWPEHGFYNFQPTFYFDLARANNYQILSFIFAAIKPLRYVQVKTHDEVLHLIKSNRIPPRSHINVLFRKTTDAEFVIPNQAYYAGALSPESARLWHELR